MIASPGFTFLFVSDIAEDPMAVSCDPHTLTEEDTNNTEQKEGEKEQAPEEEISGDRDNVRSLEVQDTIVGPCDELATPTAITEMIPSVIPADVVETDSPSADEVAAEDSPPVGVEEGGVEGDIESLERQDEGWSSFFR
eukprot:sb/3474395/